ncbi:50S ribosomal protein L29 [Candidatus Persebacteraceae bacterium Df01]|jgi:large subunit ribosomal protein L29|uniref:Large ribosomal subunit protein uL29 n=1 Tax=Candidatus Doriopsillibacter californiensis TaxID=2970740 RepID=A0ABT7QKZ7_9GAMM|nr:50S ribosomal protein L29 [Candidatus Persebacteraceae bacterium Df01]
MSQIGRRKVEVREKAIDGLREELNALRREHFNLRVQKAAQQNTKSSELRRVRRDVARVETILREKENKV